MSDPASIETAAFAAQRKLTHAQARDEQRRYWAGKTPAELIAAGVELTRRSYALLGINFDNSKTDFTVSRVPRRRPYVEVPPLPETEASE